MPINYFGVPFQKNTKIIIYQSVECDFFVFFLLHANLFFIFFSFDFKFCNIVQHFSVLPFNLCALILNFLIQFSLLVFAFYFVCFELYFIIRIQLINISLYLIINKKKINILFFLFSFYYCLDQLFRDSQGLVDNSSAHLFSTESVM